MKLLNRSLAYLSLAFLLIIGVWSVVFYYNLKDEIRDSIDDGLDNNRLLIIKKMQLDSTLLFQQEFGGNNFKIRPVSKRSALQFTDIYKDTLMYRVNEDDLEPVRILHSAFEFKGRFYSLSVISSLVEEDDLVEDAFWSVVWLFVILILTIAVVNNVVLRRVWNPFYDILAQLKAYRLSHESASINVPTNIKEFAELQKASNSLIEHSKETYLSQKQFIENASHELQTPLAIIINKLELLLESDNLNNSDANAIANVVSMAEKLSKLNKSLLLLAKIENRQFPNQELVCINSIGIEYKSNFQEFTNFKEIQITIEETAKLEVKMDSFLAEMLISNLLKNAIVHNTKGGTIRIQFTAEELTICNTGSGVALNPKTMFYRFQKDAAKNDSTGLGLAICKVICESYGISINYQFRDNQHCFTVNFNPNYSSE